MVKRPQPPRLAAKVRRDQILATALLRFARAGFAGTRTRQLAEAAGVTEPILYRHFPSKAALFAGVLRLVQERLLAALAQAMGDARDARARLAALAAALPRLLVEREEELRVLCGTAASHADLEQQRAACAALSAIGRFLTRALSGGGLRRGIAPRTAAYFVLQIGLGSALLRPVGVPAVVRKGFGDAVLGLLMAALT